MNTPLISMRGVGKNYPVLNTSAGRLRTVTSLLLGRGEVPHHTVLQGVNIELARGESLGLVGENGAGKSTLLKIVAGVVQPSTGEVRVNGSIGALLELGSGFHPEYTGRENIFLSAALMGLPRSAIASKLDSIIEFADIGEYIDQPIKHYSSGMVVRLGFAVATAMRPDILITDEVLAVGDESFQRKCICWMEEYLNSGGTLLLCSHSMFHIQTMCQKAAWIHHGQLRMFGNSYDVVREYLTYHEEKNNPAKQPERPAETAGIYHVCGLWVENAAGAKATEVLTGEGMCVRGFVHSPDDRPPVLLVGIVRADGTAVYGTHSNETAYRPERIAPQQYRFGLRLPNLKLLPGKYTVRAHAMDPEGLRLFDTVNATVTVTGETRDYGVCRLEHEWVTGMDTPQSTGS